MLMILHHGLSDLFFFYIIIIAGIKPSLVAPVACRWQSTTTNKRKFLRQQI